VKQLVLLVLLMCPVAGYSAETEPPKISAEEPTLRDHFVGLQQMQERLSQRSPEEQSRLQPQIRRAELQACQRVRQDRQEGVRDNDYQLQGGAELLANVLQFERYCETPR
jgi:hypothetical protein